MDRAEATLFGDAVYADVVQRLSVRPGAASPVALDETGRVLHHVATVEDRREDGAADPLMKRLDAKLDLAMALLARAMPGLALPPPVEVRFGVRGLRLPSAAVEAGAPDVAILDWQPADWLPMAIVLPVRRLARGEGQEWWAFDALAPDLAEELERHVFRLHRRWRARQHRPD